MNYNTQPYTEAQAQAIDEGQPRTGPTLPELARVPAVADAIRMARSVRSVADWRRDLERPLSSDMHPACCAVWGLLPGSTCYRDALRLIALARID